MRISNILILLLCLTTLASCAFLQGMFGAGGDVLSDPEVQRTAGNVVQNVIAGNWIGALYSFGELGLAGITAVKATNMMRDRRRRQRGEVYGKDAALPVIVEAPR